MHNTYVGMEPVKNPLDSLTSASTNLGAKITTSSPASDYNSNSHSALGANSNTKSNSSSAGGAATGDVTGETSSGAKI